MQVRCVHCHESMEVSDDSDFSQLTCSSCGGSFSLVGQQTLTQQSSPAATLGHFTLIDQVGTGAFGTVWAVRDRVGVFRALKVIDLRRLTEADLTCRELAALEIYCRQASCWGCC